MEDPEGIFGFVITTKGDGLMLIPGHSRRAYYYGQVLQAIFIFNETEWPAYLQPRERATLAESVIKEIIENEL